MFGLCSYLLQRVWRVLQHPNRFWMDWDICGMLLPAYNNICTIFSGDDNMFLPILKRELTGTALIFNIKRYLATCFWNYLFTRKIMTQGFYDLQNPWPKWWLAIVVVLKQFAPQNGLTIAIKIVSYPKMGS